MKKIILTSLISTLLLSKEAYEINRNGIFGVTPNRDNYFILNINDDNFIEIISNYCKINIFDENKMKVAETLFGGIRESLPNGSYEVKIFKSNACKTFNIKTNETEMENKNNIVSQKSLLKSIFQGATEVRQRADILTRELTEEKEMPNDRTERTKKREKEKAEQQLKRQIQGS